MRALVDHFMLIREAPTLLYDSIMSNIENHFALQVVSNKGHDFPVLFKRPEG